jgi:hypothetical protein
MKLSQDAEIAPEKLTRYLLVKRPIGDKSEFLKRAGYTLDNWQQLEQDIRQQLLPEEAVAVKQTGYGEYFAIMASLTGPNGVALRMKTVWMTEFKNGITKFITLYPDRGK